MGLFDRSNKEYAKIHIEFDIDKKGEGTVEVEGDEVSLAAAVGVLIHHMLRKGFNRKILEFSILKALKDNEKKEKNNIHVHEIHISKDNEKEFAEILKKIIGGTI
jgi:hypothetical protein|nr:MAG TPA: hypothetical protein [Caudoviricetes sp.]